MQVSPWRTLGIAMEFHRDTLSGDICEMILRCTRQASATLRHSEWAAGPRTLFFKEFLLQGYTFEKSIVGNT